jgi:hypothetical protein
MSVREGFGNHIQAPHALRRLPGGLDRERSVQVQSLPIEERAMCFYTKANTILADVAL